MRAYSQDLRQRVLHAVDEGKPRAEIIDFFQVSRATIKRYVKQRRETGAILPRPIPGRTARRAKRAAGEMGLPELLEAHPGAGMQDSCRWWETEHGMRVSSATMSRAMHHIGWTRI